MPRPLSVTIHAGALSHNLNVVAERLQTAAARAGRVCPFIWGVIKARAYGHGIDTAVSAFARADGLAMLDLEEVVRCRELGWTRPLLLLEGFFQSSDIPVLDHHRVTSVIHTDEQIALLQQARPEKPIPVWVKIDTGMHRLGFSPDQVPAVLQRLRDLEHRGCIQVHGALTHFANADGDPVFTALQRDRFLAWAAPVPGGFSLCNSAATLNTDFFLSVPPERIQWVRPGVCLYGASPFAEQPAAGFGLQPAMTLAAELISVRTLAAGESVGYGQLFTAQRTLRAGVVACGYADGYPRHAGTGTPVTVDGVATRLLGRVSMDMLAVDLDPVPHARVGSPVVLWGQGGPSIDQVAQASGTIGYELMCAVAPRVRRLVEPVGHN